MYASKLKRDLLSQEVNQELERRKKTWPMASKKELIFTKIQHQQRFGRMADIGKILAVLKDSEWVSLLERVERKEKREAAEKAFFSNQRNLF